MNKKNKIVYIFLTLFLTIVFYLTITLSLGNTSFFGRASGEGSLSVSNSYVFAAPLSAKANGMKVRVTVFALDGKGMGIANKRVQISCKDDLSCQSAKMAINEIQPMTDKVGQATFDIFASSPGAVEIQAKVEGITLNQTSTVNFR